MHRFAKRTTEKAGVNEIRGKEKETTSDDVQTDPVGIVLEPRTGVPELLEQQTRFVRQWLPKRCDQVHQGMT